MVTLVYVIAFLSIFGGIIVAIGTTDFYWVAIGFVSFALIGGFAYALDNLKSINNQLGEACKLLEDLVSQKSNPDATVTIEEDLPDI